MPKITVEIEWDWPDLPSWLNADNVALALHAHCKNTKFVVRDVGETTGLIKKYEDLLFVQRAGKLKPEQERELAQLEEDLNACRFVTPEQRELEKDLIFFADKLREKRVEISDYDALCQRLPERVVSEIHLAIGQASVCWEHLDNTNIFDSEQASSIAGDLCNFIADFLLEINQKENKNGISA